MKPLRFLQRLFPIESRANKRGLLAAASFVMLGSTVAACAAVPTYNPDNLQAAQFEHVSDICQNVMGLSPKEPLTGGYWAGEPRLDYYTSRYRACIVSLSDSLQNSVDAQLTQQADADCRAKGLAPNSSDLALCVLRTVNDRPASGGATLTSAALTGGAELPRATTSYYRLSPHEYVHREQLACAALGLEPSHNEFETCVKKINHALYSLDNPIT